MFQDYIVSYHLQTLFLLVKVVNIAKFDPEVCILPQTM